MVRLTAAAFLLGATTITLAPHVVSYVATSAVVNAPVITVRAPFDGVVSAASGNLSAPVARGGTLVALQADRADRTAVAELTARRTAISGERIALETTRARLTDQQADLEHRKARHRDHALKLLAARKAEAQARLDAENARLDERQADLGRHQRLAQLGALARVALSEAELGKAVSQSARAAARARLESLALAEEALRDTVPVDGVADGLSDILNRLDTLRTRLADLDQRRDTLAAMDTALGEQIAFLDARAAHSEVFAPRASTSGIIWKASPPADMPVLLGDDVVRLLDCERRFVEVAVAERHFEQIRPGDTAHIRLKGAGGWIDGHVAAVHGAGANFDRPALAAMRPGENENRLSVIVRLPAVDPNDPAVARAFCDVGRTADVRFKKAGTGLLSLARHLPRHADAPAAASASPSAAVR